MLLYTEHGEVTDYPYNDGSGQERAYRLTRRHLWVADTQLIQAQEVVTNGIVPQWSPDGRWIAFLNDTLIEGYYGHQLWVVLPDGKEQYLLVEDVREYTWLDNDRLIFIRGTFYGEQFWQVSISSQQVTSMEIVGFPQNRLNAPSVSPQTHQIAFSNRQNNVSELWLGRFDNKQIIVEARVPRYDIAHTTWNPQGTLLTYGMFFHPYQILKSDGTQVVKLSQNATNRPAFWTEDGQSFVFGSGDEIFIASADGQQVKQLTSFVNTEVDQVFWQPGETSIGFDTFEGSEIKAGILELK
jgi:Tol biopolymer transport system component